MTIQDAIKDATAMTEELSKHYKLGGEMTISVITKTKDTETTETVTFELKEKLKQKYEKHRQNQRS